MTRLVLVLLAATLAAGPVAAQVASYGGGSIYDLDPPSRQATDGQYLETIVVSRRFGRMRELRDFHESDHMRRVARPVGRLALAVRRADAVEPAYCTAALVAEDLILTNHHCIAGNPEGEVEDALLWMGYLVPRSMEGVRRYGVALEPVEESRELDYAIHRVRGRPGRDWGTVTLDPEAEIFGGKSLFIVHHPGGWQQHVSLACETGRPPRGPEGLLHVCDTLGGSSGAPVFSLGSDAMVGLHYRLVVPGELNAAKPIGDVVAASPTLRRIVREATPETAATPASIAWQVLGESEDVATLRRFAESFPGTPEADAARERARALTAAVAAMPRAAAVPDVHECDELAALPGSHPTLPGVPLERIDVPRALRACEAALDAYPDETRFMVSYGRALTQAERHIEAARLYRRAAEAGDPDAMNNLGWTYLNGRGVPYNHREAIRWFRRAAEAGGWHGMVNIGLLYANGRGVAQDDREAVRWYRRAAEAGALTGMVALGQMYREGRGVEQDEREAVRLFREAAEAGQTVGMINLGFMYVNGRGVTRDHREAVRWYRRAAEAGNIHAMKNMAIMYDRGYGVPRNEAKASEWRRRAEQAGG